MSRRPVEHSTIRITRTPTGVTRTWLGDFPSLAEARTEARRIINEDDEGAEGAEIAVVPTETWNNGEGRDRTPLA
jgi:hypothetical protein